MSNDVVIRAEGISKRYRISHLAGQETLRDTMHHAARLAWRRLRWNAKLNREDFWALRNIDFEIKRGEVVGIIGRNGAGKSTLLKVLSRITAPSTGRITLKGRVASLLEVGTGFHPELTGRDNIFLNGAILGMSRTEIRKKFDEIVAFAEVERFLDTPVKRYSSGMYVRLAFAVAAHLEPEILIVDEVLAVGDAQFQKKCLGKMESISRNSGRTILFVSHNLISVQQLCSRVIHLSAGAIAGDGPPDEQIGLYVGDATLATPRVELAGLRRSSTLSGRARYLQAEPVGRPDWQFGFTEPLALSLSFRTTSHFEDLELGVAIFTLQGVEVCSTLSSWRPALGSFGPGDHRVTVRFPALELAPGGYRVGLGLRSGRNMEDHLPEALNFQVVASGATTRPNLDGVHGIVLPTATFTREHSSS